MRNKLILREIFSYGMVCCFTLLVGAGAANAQIIKIGALDTLYNGTDLRKFPQITPSDSFCKATGKGNWPMMVDAPLITLKKNNNPNNDTTIFISTSGHGFDRHVGSLQKPFGPPGSDCCHIPNTYPGQYSGTLQKVALKNIDSSTVPDPEHHPRDRNVIKIRYNRTAGWWYDHIWIPNVYQVQPSDTPYTNNMKAGDLLGFVHIETNADGNANNQRVFSIGITYSKDTAKSWAYCGDIIRAACNASGYDTSLHHFYPTNNMAGIPYIIYTDLSNKKWFYVYFNDFGDASWYYDMDFTAGKRQCVARDTLSDVLRRAAKIYDSLKTNKNYDYKNDVPKLYKYLGNGVWASGTNNDAVNSTVEGFQIIPQCPGIPVPFHGRPGADSLLYDFHSDAVYCKELKKYLITVTNGCDPNSGFGALVLYSSTDGVNWGNPKIIDTTAQAGYFIEKPHSTFVSLASDASADCHEVGKQFYIFYAFTYLPATKNQEYFRRLITIVPDMTPITRLVQD